MSFEAVALLRMCTAATVSIKRTMWPDCTVGGGKRLSSCSPVPFLCRPCRVQGLDVSWVILGGCHHEHTVLRRNSVPDPQGARKVGSLNSRVLRRGKPPLVGAVEGPCVS